MLSLNEFGLCATKSAAPPTWLVTGMPKSIGSNLLEALLGLRRTIGEALTEAAWQHCICALPAQCLGLPARKADDNCSAERTEKRATAHGCMR